MFKAELKAGAEVTFPVRKPTTQEKKQFGTEENIFTLSWLSIIYYQHLALEAHLEGTDRWKLYILSFSSVTIHQHLPLESQDFQKSPESLFQVPKPLDLEVYL